MLCLTYWLCFIRFIVFYVTILLSFNVPDIWVWIDPFMSIKLLLLLLLSHNIKTSITWTTRTPSFWGYPPPPHDYPYYWPDRIRSQAKTRQSHSYKFEEIAKTSNLLFLIRIVHATHTLKLLDKICKYEMDPASIIEDTERTRFYPQTGRRRRWN